MAVPDSPRILDDVNKEAIRLFYGFKETDRSLKYFNATNGTGLPDTNVKDGVINKNVVDDIISIALWHRTLDPPYFGETLIERTMNKVELAFTLLFGKYKRNVSYNLSGFRFIPNINFEKRNSTVRKYVSFLTKGLFSVRDKFPREIGDDYDFLKNDEIMNVEVETGNRTVKIKDLLENLKDLILTVLFDASRINSSLFSINEIFDLVHSWNKDNLLKDGISPQKAERISKQMAVNMKREFRSSIDQELTARMEILVYEIALKINANMRNEDIINSGDYQFVDENTPSFMRLLKAKVDLNIKKLFKKNGIEVARPNLNNPYQKKIVDNVISQSSNLHPLVTKLWINNVDIRDQDNNYISWEDYLLNHQENNNKLRLNILNMREDGSINKISQMNIPLLNGVTNAFEMTSCSKEMDMQEKGLIGAFLTGEDRKNTVVVQHSNITPRRNILRVLYNVVYRHSEFNFDNVNRRGLFKNEEERTKFMKHLCINYEQSLQHLSVYNPRNEALAELDSLVKRSPKEREDLYKVSQIKEITQASLNVFETLYDFTTNSIYAYNPDGKLYKRDAEGNFTIDISPGTDEGREETRKACDVLGVKREDCVLFLSDCLLNGDVNGIKKCSGLMVQMNEDELDKFIKGEIDNIYPPLALRVLQLLGIRKKKLYSHEAKKPIYVVESVAHWLHDFVGKKFEGTFQSKVAKNSKLLKYLNAMVQFVNNHPGLLNKDYTGAPKTKESQGTFLGLPRSGNFPIRDSMVQKLDRLEQHIRREADIVKANPTVNKMLEFLGRQRDYMVPSFMYDTLGGLIKIRDPTLLENSRYLISSLITNQFGGDVHSENLAKDLIEGKSFGSADSMRELYNHILKLLDKENKQLDSSTANSFEKMLKDLRNAEETVINELNIIRDFVEIYRRHSHSTSVHDILSLHDIEQYAKQQAAHERSLKKGEIALVKNLKKLAENLGVTVEEGDITITKHENLNLE